MLHRGLDHMIEVVNKVIHTSRKMLNEIGREPTPEELAEKLGMPLEKVRKVLKLAREPLSIETPVGDEEDVRLGDLIEDKNAIQPIDAAIQSNLRETTTRVLASLTPREERILRMRFGIGMHKDHTLESGGQQASVTRKREIDLAQRRIDVGEIPCEQSSATLDHPPDLIHTPASSEALGQLLGSRDLALRLEELRVAATAHLRELLTHHLNKIDGEDGLVGAGDEMLDQRGDDLHCLHVIVIGRGVFGVPGLVVRQPAFRVREHIIGALDARELFGVATR